MDTRRTRTVPNLYAPVPVFSDEINRKIIQSEVEGGVYLKDLPQGAELEVETENRSYHIVLCEKGQALISGHPQFCPTPIRVHIRGSSWGGSMLKVAYLGRGMHLEFGHPEFHTITTSRIREIRRVPEPAL